jgi:hypothetical protein
MVKKMWSASLNYSADINEVAKQATRVPPGGNRVFFIWSKWREPCAVVLISAFPQKLLQRKEVLELEDCMPGGSEGVVDFSGINAISNLEDSGGKPLEFSNRIVSGLKP